MTLDLAVVGNLLVDDVVYEDGRTRMAQPGGATLYAALGAALWGVRVGIVAVVGDDYPSPVLDELATRGIDLAGLRPLGRPGLRTWLLYEGRRRHVVHRLDGPTHAEVSPTAADLGAVEAPAFHLAPMPFDVQSGLVEALASREATVSLDPYELLTEENLDAWKGLLAGVDEFLLSEDEMMLAGGLERPREILARRFAAPAGGARPRQVCYKRGALGGLVYDPRCDRFLTWPAASAAVVDPTGAGDAFAGGLLAGRLLGEPLARALGYGAVSAAFAVEGEGAAALLAAGPEAARRRLRGGFGR